MSTEAQRDPNPKQRRHAGRLIAGLLVAACLVGAILVLLPRNANGPLSDLDEIRTSDLPQLEPEAQALRDEAFAVAARLVEKYPRDPEAIFSKAGIHNRFGDSEVAVACWHHCLKQDPQFALAYYCLGWNALDHRQYDESVEFLEKAVKLDATMGHAYLLLAQALMDSNRTAEAELPLQTHLRLMPQSVPGHCQLGQVYLEAKQHERAKRYFNAALEINPASSAARDGLIAALEGLGETQQAEEYRDKSAEESRDPADPGLPLATHAGDLQETQSAAAFALTDAGKVYGARGELTEALRCWRRAAEIDSRNTECRQLLVSICQQSGDYEIALRFLAELSDIEPGNAVHQINFAVLASQVWQFDAAEKAFRRVQQLIPDRYEGYAGLARLYLTTDKNIPEARSLAQKAVELAPIADHFYLLGMAHFKSGDSEEALTALERATELDRDNPVYRQALDTARAKIEERK